MPISVVQIWLTELIIDHPHQLSL